MNIQYLAEVETEIKRFQQKIKELKKKAVDNGGDYYPSKETASVKRASMDLSNALIKIRNNRYQ